MSFMLSMNQNQFEKTATLFRCPSLSSHHESARAAHAPGSSLAEQYWVLASHVGLVDRSWLTKLRLLGKDSVDLLQRLSTNDLKVFLPGSCAQTVLTTEKGRVIDFVTLYRLSQSDVILICHAPRERVFNWIEKFIIMEDVNLSDMTEAYSVFSLFGPGVEKVLATVGLNHSEFGVSNSAVEVKVGELELVVGGAEAMAESSANILVPVDDADSIWRKLFDEGPPAGLRALGNDALEIHRVERGFPVHGRELTEDVNPLEAGLERFVSFTKGCYIGQEVIARLDTYKRLQKRLVGLRFANNCTVRQGARVTVQGNDVGWVTSAAQSLRINRTIALAYVGSAWAVPGKSVEIQTESGMQEAQVVQLPFEG